MAIYGLICPKLEFTDQYCDTDTLFYSLRSQEYKKVTVDRNAAQLRVFETGMIYGPKSLKKSNTDHYNRLSDYAKTMAAFILSLSSGDVVLMPDITMLGRTEGEILFVYHLAWNHGVHLEFNRGKYGNTENFMHCGISNEKELSKLMDHLLRPLIREMRTERMEETAGESVNNLPSEIKKN